MATPKDLEMLRRRLEEVANEVVTLRSQLKGLLNKPAPKKKAPAKKDS